jgi:hypothetical protein
LGIIFGLFVAFIAAQVWGDSDRANAAVDREASALRSVVILAASFPGELSRSGRAPRNVAAGGGRRAPYPVRVDASGRGGMRSAYGIRSSRDSGGLGARRLEEQQVRLAETCN